MYKNLYPEDFAKLSCNEGELYSIFQAKSEIIKNKINEVEKEIIPLEQEVKDIEKQIDIDIKELRLIYIAKIFSKKQADTYIKDNVQDFVTDEKFLDLRNNTTFSGYILSRNTYPGSMQVKTFTYNFSNIEKEINSDYSYDQREMFLTELKRNKMLSCEVDTYFLSHYNEDNNTLDKYIILYDKINKDIIIHRRKY